jgi:hypothetical protein
MKKVSCTPIIQPSWCAGASWFILISMEGYDRRWVLGTWEGYYRKPSGALIAFFEDSTQDFWQVQQDF